jgi:hypothetical protein
VTTFEVDAQVNSSYEVVTSSVTVLAAGANRQEFRLTAPTGKRPLAGSCDDPRNASYGDYPDGTDWVFAFYPLTPDRTVNLYLVCAAI